MKEPLTPARYVSCGGSATTMNAADIYSNLIVTNPQKSNENEDYNITCIYYHSRLSG